MNKILVLGAGFVAKPLIRYLLERNFFVRVAAENFLNVLSLIKNRKNGEAIEWSTENKAGLRKMIGEADLVVSLLPFRYHVEVAEICIEAGKHLVTSSYESEQMRLLGPKAKEAGVLLLNEMGLDPGIDHMSAMEKIDKAHAEGGKILSFRSLCGAVPAPEASDNPFRYKFSWNPKGVVYAASYGARYKEKGKIVEISSEDLFRHGQTIYIDNIGDMEVYSNRDAVRYLDLYTIADEAHSIFRGTIRYPGWCDLWTVISNLGLLNADPQKIQGDTYREFMKKLTRANDVKKAIADKFQLAENNSIIEKLDWLGLFADSPIPKEKASCLDILVDRLQKQLLYQENERDMIVLRDEIVVNYNGVEKTHTSTLIQYGNEEDRAVARTVSLPAACAAKLILGGKIKVRGNHIPVISEIYQPILQELSTLGIEIECHSDGE